MANEPKKIQGNRSKASGQVVSGDAKSSGGVFKAVLEDDKDQYELRNGELVPKVEKGKGKLAAEAEEVVEESVDETVDETTQKELEALPDPQSFLDGTPMGKIRFKKAAKEIAKVKQKTRKRVQEITREKKTHLTEIGDYTEFVAIVEEAAELYPNCDFEVGENQVNFTKNNKAVIENHFYVRVIRPNGEVKTTSMAERKVTFEHLITFLDEAAV